mmetsp:Transcript_29519/g.91798  ORF Transcript_29519/g.91798 Transcript_29519/m.91798 type:complete len:558 (+) Transcript_29519:93-1766(+)
MSEVANLPGLPPGFKKETTRHPPSQKYLPPRVGDEVEVHCVGSLKRGGQRFLSTRENGGKPMKYKVGQGEVIEGWDLAVQNMKKGEHATFTIPAEYAYKDAGHGDAASPEYVPPDSVVVLEIELVRCPAREDLFEDGGVVKLEQRDGPGGRQPRSGDECQITYKVHVEGDGVAMASRGAMYKMGSQQLGTMGKPIDKALATMKRGDEVLLTLQPSYGFGQGNYVGKAVEIMLILEEIYEVYDMSLAEKDKTVLRKRIKEGDGSLRVHDTAKVKVQVNSATANGEKVLAEPKTLSFIAGNGEVCDALEGSVVDLRETEEAILRCESSESVAGGLLGLPDGLEPPIMIHIVVVSVEKVPEKWDLDAEGRLERGRARREAAAELYKRGRIRLACHHFELIADLFVSIDFFKAELQKDATELRRIANLNRAMCMLKFGNFKLAKELCSKVLKEDPGNPKALFRRGKAMLALKEYTEAIEDLERLIEVEPGSGEGKTLLREAKRLRKQSDGQASRTFAKMCAGLGQLPEREDRRDDDVVVMPDMNAEYAKIAQKHGIVLNKK